jgi:hypothetical protein
MSRVEKLLVNAATAMGMSAKKVLGIHSSVVAKMAQGYLECMQCHRREALDFQKVSCYLDYGWPLCCGQTMDIEGYMPGGAR